MSPSRYAPFMISWAAGPQSYTQLLLSYLKLSKYLLYFDFSFFFSCKTNSAKAFPSFLAIFYKDLGFQANQLLVGTSLMLSMVGIKAPGIKQTSAPGCRSCYATTTVWGWPTATIL